nr:hypothetical protein Saspl_007799 [Ipomoea trifida]
MGPTLTFYGSKKIKSLCESHAARPAGACTTAVAQDIHDKEEAGKEAEAEQANPLLDPHAHRQYYPLQRQASPLAPHQARVLRILSTYSMSKP